MPDEEERRPRFRTVQKLKLDYTPASITQYESTRTGMRAVVVDQEGPKVNGYFALATEVFDDSGAPHTLEHLCFMGSKSYQYKGLLDKLATRAYSTTNAWTAVDQTTYTLQTAGWHGFAQILPVYLEHLIVPTLTDEACYTEVHHIDGKGNDAGVVYSEMQGVQNDQAELMDLKSRRLVYPEGVGFRYETGGMMEQLRSLTAARIRQFHKEMYQPKNLCLLITGEVDHNHLLHILDNFEDTIMEHVPSLDAPFKRPWVDSDPAPLLEETIVDTVEFPEEDESTGEIVTVFFGPKCNDDTAMAALGILLTYLMGSSVSVLENTMVEKEQLCSMCYFSTDMRPNTAIWIGLSAVETENLRKVEKRLFELLKEVASNPLDMSYMHDCIRRWRRQIKMRSENAADFFSVPIIDDHLYGHRDGRDLKSMQTLQELDVIEEWSDQQWRDFLSKWFADAKHVSMLGIPSKDLSDKITSDEKARIKAQRERLGEQGMKELEEKLRKAQEANNRPIPDELLESFPIPSAESVHFISTTTARAGTARSMGKLDNNYQHIIDMDDKGLPLFLHFEHIQSNFVRFKLNICTGSIPVELKPLISLYLMNFFTTPVEREGKQMEFEDVVLELERLTTGFGADSEQSHGELITIAFDTEPENYAIVISWLRSMLYDAIHDPGRLYASLTKSLADIPEEKRSAQSMLFDVDAMLKYDQASSIRARATLSQALYLKRFRKMLKEHPEAALERFSQLCESLHQPENLRVYVAADITSLPNPVASWNMLLNGRDTSKPLQPVPSRKALLSKSGQNPGTTAFIVPMATSDSSFALLTSLGPDTYEHPDIPALMVAMSYMDAAEGPHWVGVRGEGLAYGTRFSRNTDTGLVSFVISRSPDAYRAFAASKETLARLASGAVPLDKFGLEGAISEIVLRMAEEQPTMASAASLSYVNQVIRGISKDFSHRMLSQVQDVSPNQVRSAMNKYLMPLFEAATANLVITCAQIMEEDLVKNFKAAGFQAEVKPLEHFQDAYGLEAQGEEEADDEEADSEDESEGNSDDEVMIDTPEGSDE